MWTLPVVVMPSNTTWWLLVDVCFQLGRLWHFYSIFYIFPPVSFCKSPPLPGIPQWYVSIFELPNPRKSGWSYFFITGCPFSLRPICIISPLYHHYITIISYPVKSSILRYIHLFKDTPMFFLPTGRWLTWCFSSSCKLMPMPMGSDDLEGSGGDGSKYLINFNQQ